mgnify:CR=1 FL=1
MLRVILSIIPLTKTYRMINKLNLKSTNSQSYYCYVGRRYVTENAVLFNQLKMLLSEWSAYTVYSNLDSQFDNLVLRCALLLIYINYKKCYDNGIHPALHYIVRNKLYLSIENKVNEIVK